jgi:RES domain-containing protein
LISAWRITKKKHIKTALTGEGARLYGGRWNSKGKPVIYTAESRALAVVEMLVHLDTSAPLSRYVVIEVQIDETLVQEIDLAVLPGNWRAEPAPKRLKAIGDEWLEAGASPVLRVPSAVVQGEFNYLLNPAHPGFANLHFSKPEGIGIDKRLK